MIKNAALFLLSLLLTVSCGGVGGSMRSGDGRIDTLRYAVNISCERGDGYTAWTLRNPWDSAAILHTYLLVPAEAPLPSYLPSGTLVRTPLRRAGVATAVTCGLVDELGCAAAIAGVCEKEYIDLPVVTRGLASGRIADFGNGMNPNIERIMDVSPDALLLTPFEHSGYGRLERLGIPIIECAEYMETSPLARAEWIRFYGELFGAENVADSIFSAVEHDYLALKQKAQGARTSPKLLDELLYGSQWFLPCGQSTMGRMFADAGADYLFRNREGSGSVGLPFETVLDEAQDADVWLVKFNTPMPLTYHQLATDYQPYTRFRAFREQHIYGCDLAHNHFYEETPFHPERLLRDLIIILHPELMPGEQTRYYKPLDP